MSVSDPLVKELKGYVTKFLTESLKPITDEESTLQDFCDCFERILLKGLQPQKTVIAVVLIPDCWDWLKKLGEENIGVPYSYCSSVEEVQKNARITTNRGKVNEEKCCIFYRSSSVLGDPILASVLTSILLCLSTITFSLNLENAAFLDTSWDLPLITSTTFVPTSTLGLSIMFVEGKALIHSVMEDSVAAESGLIESGDVLDTVNGIVINKSKQGSLSRIIKKGAKRPISVHIIKGMKEGKAYTPLLPYWHQAGLDPILIQANSEQLGRKENKEEEGKVRLVGSVKTGNRGDIKQINLAINNLQESTDPHPVSIECHPLGIKLISLRTNTVAAMPRQSRQRKTNRQSWSQENMTRAIEEVLKGRMGYLKASKTFDVPQSTLEDRIKKARANNYSPKTAAIKRLGRYETVFTLAQEKELVQHVLLFEERLFGLTLTNLRELAFQLGEKNGISHPFSKEKRKAGKDWMYGFLGRHMEAEKSRKHISSTCKMIQPCGC